MPKAQNPTLLDVASTITSNGTVKPMIEALSNTNGFFDDVTIVEANDGTSNEANVRTGLPSGTFRRLYQGVQPEKSEKVTVKDKSAQLTSYSVLDKALHDRQGSNAGPWRQQEDTAFLEGMSQNMITALFYGNSSTSPEQFDGLSSRYSTTNEGVANHINVIDGGGTGNNNTSIYLIAWSPQTVAMFYPQGTQAGLQIQDKGQVTATDANGGEYEAYKTYFEWNSGLTVLDWRAVVRIANIDVTKLKGDASSGADLVDLMDDAIACLPEVAGARPVWYMNKKVYSVLRKQVENKAKYQIQREDFYGNGRKVPTYEAFPIRTVEQLLKNEETVTNTETA